MELFKKTDIDTSGWNEPIKVLGVDIILGIDARKLAEFISFDKTEISDRQKIYIDFIKNPELTGAIGIICEKISNILDLRSKKIQYNDMEHCLYDLKILEMYIEVISKLEDIYQGFYDKLQSEKLKLLLSNNHAVYVEKDFISIKDYVNDIHNQMMNIRSLTIGINLDAKLEPLEIGIISMNSDFFVSKNFFTKYFQKNDSEEKYVTPFVSMSKDNNLLEQKIYVTLNKNLIKAVGQSKMVLAERLSRYCSDIISNYYDLLYLTKTVKFVYEYVGNGYNICFPDTVDDRIDIKDAYDPRLIGRVSYNRVVRNDIYFEMNTSRVEILTGANGGGKSVYLRLIGLEIVLFQLGMPIFAQKAVMRIADKLLLHVPAMIDDSENSRFITECKKMREILDAADSNTIILMDETFSGTSSAEAAAIANQVLKSIRYKRSLCLYSTHIHEIVSQIEELNRDENVFVPLKVEMKNGTRTYKVVFNAYDDYSHAGEIASKYGLAFNEE